MSETEARKPEEILNELFNELQDEDVRIRLQAISKLQEINYSSAAIRAQLEKLAASDTDEDIRRNAAVALGQPTQRFVQSRLNKIDRGTRNVLIKEIADWETSGLLEKQKADIIRQRYNFDFNTAISVPLPAAPIQSAPSSVTQTPAANDDLPPVQAGQVGRSLVQSLLSETSIKIFLYLGAFFVIASAVILGAAVPEARLPVLILGTILFGGLSIGIRKRLPQPSFALFIIFSFLLPITANVIGNLLDLSAQFNAGYWTIIYLMMTIVWAGSTWLYESRLFSITAFISFALAFYRIGDLFSAEAEVYFLLLSMASLGGLGGVWLAKKWKGKIIALPLFLTAQILQISIIFGSLVLYMIHFFETSPQPLWNLVLLIAWGLAFLFYGYSNSLFPFPLFPWMTAATLISVPWLLGSAFKLDNFNNTIIFFAWGALLASGSEIISRLLRFKKYSLPILLISLPTFITSLIFGFLLYGNFIAMGIALGIGVIYTILHALHNRAWLWALALINFLIAYLSFYSLSFMDKFDIPFAYQILSLSILLLMPEAIFGTSQTPNQAWRIPPRIFGILFTTWTVTLVLVDSNRILAPIIYWIDTNFAVTAITFWIYSIFFTWVALRKRSGNYGYLPAACLPLAIFFTLEYFKVDAWLLSLTLLAVFYFAAGAVTKFVNKTANEDSSHMLRYSGLTLGVIVSFSAAILLKEHGSWTALIIGFLFMLEMYISGNGVFEIGLPILFVISAMLGLDAFKIETSSYHLLVYSMIWIVSDLAVHLTFTQKRPLKTFVRGVAAVLTFLTFVFLFFGDTKPAVIGFGIYTLLFLTVSLLYRKPILLYAFTAALPLFITFLFRDFNLTKWIHPVIFIAIFYYVAGFVLRKIERAKNWSSTLLLSGLGLSLIVSLAAPILGGLDAAIPVALAATLWAVEALARKNVWLGFPANSLYLLSYFIILYSLHVDQPQFFSIGAALLGLFQHYLLTRAGSRTGAFITGMVSQLILLGTTYIQLLGTESFIYFVGLFFQSIAVLAYGLIIRSRSLTFTPIILVVLGVITVIYSKLQGLNTVLIIGCTGLVLLVFGVLAVVMRERITRLGEQLSSWKA